MIVDCGEIFFFLEIDSEYIVVKMFSLVYELIFFKNVILDMFVMVMDGGWFSEFYILVIIYGLGILEEVYFVNEKVEVE